MLSLKIEYKDIKHAIVINIPPITPAIVMGVERPAGKTKWSFKSLFSYAFKGIFSFSSTPITMAGVIAEY